VRRGRRVRLGAALSVRRERRASGRDLRLLHQLSVRVRAQRRSCSAAVAGEEVPPPHVAVVNGLPQEASVPAPIAHHLLAAHSRPIRGRVSSASASRSDDRPGTLMHGAGASNRPVGSDTKNSIPEVSAVEPGS
jgi:hypothetical protein